MKKHFLALALVAAVILLISLGVNAYAKTNNVLDDPAFFLSLGDFLFENNMATVIDSWLPLRG